MILRVSANEILVRDNFSVTRTCTSGVSYYIVVLVMQNVLLIAIKDGRGLGLKTYVSFVCSQTDSLLPDRQTSIWE